MLRGGYPGEPDNHGLAWTTREDMAAFCGLASEHGIQVVTHAIGDEAISRVLDSGVTLLDGGEGTARETRRRLEAADLLENGPGALILENSLDTQEIIRRSRRMLGLE